jgi:hypothetical protein
MWHVMFELNVCQLHMWTCRTHQELTARTIALEPERPIESLKVNEAALVLTQPPLSSSLLIVLIT